MDASVGAPDANDVDVVVVVVVKWEMLKRVN